MMWRWLRYVVFRMVARNRREVSNLSGTPNNRKPLNSSPGFYCNSKKIVHLIGHSTGAAVLVDKGFMNCNLSPAGGMPGGTRACARAHGDGRLI